MGRSLTGEDEACSSFASIDLEHQREIEGRDEKIQFLEANLRRTQDQLERLSDEKPANITQLNNRIAAAEQQAAEYKQREEHAASELRNALIHNNQLTSERDQLLSELDRRGEGQVVRKNYSQLSLLDSGKIMIMLVCSRNMA